MVRFSCFIAQMHSQKPKKTVEASAEAMHHALKDHSLIQTPGNSLNPLPSESGEDTQIGDDARHVEQCWKAESMKGELNSGNEIGGHKTTGLRKSQSLGSALYLKGRHSAEDEIIDDETDLEFSCADSHGEDRFAVSGGKKDVGQNEPSENLKAMDSDSVQISSNIVNNESIFSIGDPHALEKEGHEDSDTHLSVGATDNHLPQTPPITIKPRSLPDIGLSARLFGDFSPPKYSAFRSRSCEDLLILCTRRQYVPESQIKVRQEGQRDSNIGKIEDDNLENSNGGGYDSISYTGLGKDWIVPVMDEGSKERNNEVDFVHQHHQMPAKDFRIKRIEDWVDSLQHCGPLEENDELSHVDIEVKHDTNAVKDLIAGRADAKVSPGMEAAKRYISSLSATASTAQLTNHGLVVIPFLSCFVSLKVLNLSGNAIVKITAGALPRGLHVLNLSKNNISTIEGLRELTRLRVLDLSYNRIIRIGHGLASCSSLKELYLAGNKISEVEGLHRLLKLTVLDLRFNKISTAKCLGQLAANYSSLQAISLEGNPAQKNVGDEHLKKYLQSLLPHLTYYNRHPIKVGTLKDATDRPVRLGVNAHQFDRGPRFDHKSKRKTSHGLGSHRPASTSTHGLKDHTGVLPPIRSKGKHVTLPPTGSNRQPFEFGSKLLNLKPNLSMPRSRSEGTLRPL